MYFKVERLLKGVSEKERERNKFNISIQVNRFFMEKCKKD